MRPNGARDPVAGPDNGPESPFPIRLSGPVIKGFGRGSKELGIPTANIPAEGLAEYPDLQVGVYYGVVALDPTRFVYDTEASTAQVNGNENGNGLKKKTAAATILPAVLSIGYNPFYKNKTRSIEIHVMPPLTAPSPTSTEQPGETTFHKLPDFYATRLNLLILGYIRPEFDYVSLEALVEDIRVDCEVARQSLMRGAYVCYLQAGEDGDSSCPDQVKSEKKWLTRFDDSCRF